MCLVMSSCKGHLGMKMSAACDLWHQCRALMALRAARTHSKAVGPANHLLQRATSVVDALLHAVKPCDCVEAHVQAHSRQVQVQYCWT